MKHKINITMSVPVEIDVALDRENVDVKILSANRADHVPLYLLDEVRTAVEADFDSHIKILNDLLQEAGETVHLRYDGKIFCGAEGDDLLAIENIPLADKYMPSHCRECIATIHKIFEDYEKRHRVETG
jgi:hypothetical protein